MAPPKEGSALLPTAATSPVQLLYELPRPRLLLLGALWTVSLVLNIVAVLPGTYFIRIDTVPPGLLTPEQSNHLLGDYTIFHTINLLFDLGITWLAVVLVLWSICFPFVKLAWICVLLVVPMGRRNRACQVAWLGQLGRLSLIDINFALVLAFVFLRQDDMQDNMPGPLRTILAALLPAGDGVGFEARLESGFVIFTFAILASICAGLLLELHITPVRYATLPFTDGATPPSTDGVASMRPIGMPRSLLGREPFLGSVGVGLALLLLSMTVLGLVAPFFTVGRLNLEIEGVDMRALPFNILDEHECAAPANPPAPKPHANLPAPKPTENCRPHAALLTPTPTCTPHAHSPTPPRKVPRPTHSHTPPRAATQPRRWSVASALGALIDTDGVVGGFVCCLNIVLLNLLSALALAATLLWLFLAPSPGVPHERQRLARILSLFSCTEVFWLGWPCKSSNPGLAGYSCTHAYITPASRLLMHACIYNPGLAATHTRMHI